MMNIGPMVDISLDDLCALVGMQTIEIHSLRRQAIGLQGEILKLRAELEKLVPKSDGEKKEVKI